MPEKEAKRYGDKAFTQMMYAKIVTVQLINRMGYDVLFQVSRISGATPQLNVMLLFRACPIYFDVHFQYVYRMSTWCGTRILCPSSMIRKTHYILLTFFSKTMEPEVCVTVSVFFRSCCEVTIRSLCVEDF